MKTIKTLSAAALLCALFTSCKKEYTCHCSFTSNAGDAHFVIKDRKKNAEQTCQDYKTNNPSLYSSCSL